MVMGLMWGRRGVIGETGADVEAAGICFHVGDVGVGVVVIGHGRRFGHLGASRVCWMLAVCRLLPEYSRIKKPCKPMFTGHGWSRGDHRESVWLLVWPGGWVLQMGRRWLVFCCQSARE